MKKYLSYILLSVFLFTVSSCGSDDDNSPTPDTPQHYRRTIIAYISADNNLSQSLNSDLNEMVEGSTQLASDCQLLAFVDMKNGSTGIYRIAGGKKEMVRSWSTKVYSTSSDTMLEVFQWIISNYPADEYATILEGHGTGSLVVSHSSNDWDTIPGNVVRQNAATAEPIVATSKEQTSSHNAYGYDDNGPTSGSTKIWMNIPSLAAVFSHLPKMQYIFFDCCCMGNIETVYEMRKYTDYIVAPVSEVPGDGAPYDKIIPFLGIDKAAVGDSIIDKYTEQFKNTPDYGICISNISTNETALQELLFATKNLVKKLPDDGEGHVSPMTNVVFYYNLHGSTINVKPVLHDIKSVFRQNNISDSEITEWENALKKVVRKTYPVNPTNFKWLSAIGVIDYRWPFTCDAANYCGLSMFIPLAMYDDYAKAYSTISLNKSMYNLEWTRKVYEGVFGY